MPSLALRNRSRLAPVAWALCGIVALSAPAAADAIYAVFEKPVAGAVAVKGAPADADMARLGALAVNSAGFGIRNALVIDPSDAAIGPGRAEFVPLTLALPLGPGVPALLQTAGAGGHYGDVTLHFRTSGDHPVEYATLALKVVVVSSVEIAATTAGPPQASVTLTYGSMKLDLFPLDAKGAPARTPDTGQWNVMTDTAAFAKVPKP